MKEITLEGLRSFNKKRVVKNIRRFLQLQLKDSGQENFIIGVSGGIDSSVTTKLLARAVDPDNIIGLFLPDEVTPSEDAKDARKLCANIGIELKEIPIDGILSSTLEELNGKDLSKRTVGNLKARTRMMLLYVFSNEYQGLVTGTSDKSETFIGYFTKWGDGVADIAPIQGLYKTQVRTLGRHLNLPENIVKKPSTPGLWEGQTAKKELGLTYKEIDLVLHGFFDLELSRESLPKATGVSAEKVDKVLERWRKSMHKRMMPPSPSLPL